jgi:hypothetical protein
MFSFSSGAKRAKGKSLPKTNLKRFGRLVKTLNQGLVILKKLGAVWKLFLKSSPASGSGVPVLEVLKILVTLLYIFWS